MRRRTGERCSWTIFDSAAGGAEFVAAGAGGKGGWPVGDTHPRDVNVRIIAASNRDLGQMVAAGGFREDLLYRLDVVKLQLPPLRHRREDIPLLVHHFLGKYSREMNKHVSGRDQRGDCGLLLSLRLAGAISASWRMSSSGR